MKLLRKLIGSWTLPEDVYICSLGDYWIEVDGAPYTIKCDRGIWYYEDSGYKYCYQKIKQSFWGVWIKETQWLNKDTELTKLIK